MDSNRTQLRKVLGSKIEQLRRKAGLSQFQLAKELGYTSQSTISKIETGSFGMSPTTIVEAAKLFHISAHFLFSPEAYTHEEWTAIRNLDAIIRAKDHPKRGSILKMLCKIENRSE